MRRFVSAHRHAIALLLAALGAYLLLHTIVDPGQLTDALADVTDTLGAWTYALVGALAFLETGAFVGLAAPGETVIVIGGAAAQHGNVSLPVIAAIAWAAAFAGDTTSFMLGRRHGPRVLAWTARRAPSSEARLASVETFFARHGGKTALLGRFVGVVRALAPFLAGASGMSYRTFAPWSLAGTGIWALTFTAVGYAFASSFESAAKYVVLAMVALVAIVVSVIALRRRGAQPEVVMAT